MGAITTTDGTEIFYKDWGWGQPVVFSHGWPLSADDWDTQMLFFLQQGYRVIAHDRRGHGRSTQTSDGHDMDHYADDLAALTAQLDLKDAVHVGHSTGGGEVVDKAPRGRFGWREASVSARVGDTLGARPGPVISRGSRRTPPSTRKAAAAQPRSGWYSLSVPPSCSKAEAGARASAKTGAAPLTRQGHWRRVGPHGLQPAVSPAGDARSVWLMHATPGRALCDSSQQAIGDPAQHLVGSTAAFGHEHVFALRFPLERRTGFADRRRRRHGLE